MKIDLSGIIQEVGASTAFDERARLDPVVVGGSEVRFPEAVRARGVASNTGNGIYVEGDATGIVELECSRCLTRFTQPFDVGFEALFVDPAVYEKTEAIEGEEEGRAGKQRKTKSRYEDGREGEVLGSKGALEADMGVYPLEGEQADISVAIIAEVGLSLPMKPLCKPDCKGICPICGKNLNEGECSCRPKEEKPGVFGQKLLEALRSGPEPEEDEIEDAGAEGDKGAKPSRPEKGEEPNGSSKETEISI